MAAAMAVLPIIKYPHRILRQPCEDIADITGEVRRLAEDMRQTMIDAGGIGLAAPQVGKSLRLLVADVSEERTEPVCLANPEIIGREGETTMEEGCLSAPGITASVVRAQSVVVRGIDMRGRETDIAASELLAVCLQHEIDHLNGVLFFDHISKLKRDRLLAKYQKAKP